ncbi:hypothetical protein GMDG_07955 [Pseudogymnoascus destructans 20631-21]|uniref:Uncharacterized protein n=2 Tax=Pseudogymnoascus destructans TaxID=655981 RepID=L8FZI5_PSED2|nr:hypothetical protein GMDG_07955 [Pseudogymnoascus destructans 20631-21]
MLWRGEGRAAVEMGLGMEVTIKKYGYAWFMDRIQWEAFRFKDEYADRVPSLDLKYARMFRGSHAPIQSTGDALELFSGLLRVFAADDVKVLLILQLMCHVCFRQFRYDVRKTLKSELLSPDSIDDDTSLKFSWAGVQEGITCGVSIVIGNKTALHTPDLMFRHFWGDDITYSDPPQVFFRKHFDKIAFRVMYRKSKTFVQESGVDLRSYENLFQHLFFEYQCFHTPTLMAHSVL